MYLRNRWRCRSCGVLSGTYLALFAIANFEGVYTVPVGFFVWVRMTSKERKMLELHVSYIWV